MESSHIKYTKTPLINVKICRLRARFDKAGKKNLHEYVFKGHNHDLNYQDWIAKGEISEGIKKMFETAEALKK